MWHLTSFLLSMLVVFVDASAQKNKPSEEINGLQQKISLSFFLERNLNDFEKRAKATRKDEDIASYWYLKELLKKPPIVLLSASSVIDQDGEKIEDVCEPVISGTTGFLYKAPGVGIMYGEISIKWDDVKIIRSYKDKKDLAHGFLIIEVTLIRNKDSKEISKFLINRKERYVIFNQQIKPNRVYLLNEKEKIFSTINSR